MVAGLSKKILRIPEFNSKVCSKGCQGANKGLISQCNKKACSKVCQGANKGLISQMKIIKEWLLLQEKHVKILPRRQVMLGEEWLT